MNPWHLIWFGIGWSIVGTCVLGALGFVWFKIITPLAALFVVWRRYRRTRNVIPQKGDRWWQGDTRLDITRITDTGRICMTTGSASWSDSPEQWAERVRERWAWKETP